MHRRHLLALPLAAGISAPAIRTAAAQSATVMRLSHQYPPSHHIAGVLANFAAEVKARSNGAVDVQVFPAEQLARVAENFPGVARGAFEAAVATNFTWGNTIPEMSAQTVPFFFTGLEQNRRFPKSEARRFLDGITARRAVRSVAWLFTTNSAIFTSGRKALVNPEDFRGVKIRGINTLIDQSLTAVGAAPAATPAPEVVGALQSGILDAGLTDVSAAVSRRFYEVQKYGTVSPFFSVSTQVYVNPRWWDGLRPDARSVIEAALEKAEVEAVDVTVRTAEAAVGELREKGMTITVQTPEQVAQWRDVMQKPVMDAFLRQAPENGPRLLELLRAV
ncbi:C4-dicarboxylate ABC transporter [Roseomonas sp. KE2513]|uniref:TRAP transporter substrate-binding protein DctP n=1 Tax=Roseomonas sp. KE2513 TaxID=2479202 RepID=UPI0018DFCC88|nr:TRAP transporter substrate-binding protein DctP [Roseomonas sp. KE2513]MBI0535416.1 C4-dicarboxylate ABC transporter [Roseomonas sp. KE2513]